MKITIVRLICLLSIAAVCLQFFPVLGVCAEEEVYVGEAYKDLATEEMRTAYRLLDEGIAGLSPVIQFENYVEINYSEMVDVIRAVCVDHPQYFWFLETGTYYYSGTTTFSNIATFEPIYILNGKTVNPGSQELADAMFAFHNRVQEIVNGIPVNLTTEYEIALYLHDYLAEHVSYTLEGEHPSAYAALVLGQAACYGYSKAYQCLLNAAGIRARTITGDSDDANGNRIGHAWNQIWLDGECYYADVTWDDLEQITSHSCFAVSLSKISQDHYADPEFVLPVCSHNALDYYSLSQGPGSAAASLTTTAKEIAPYFRLNGMTEEGAEFICEIRYSEGVFWTWFERIADALRLELGLSPMAKVYYYNMYDVYILKFIDPTHDGKLPEVSSIVLNESDIELTGVGSCYQLRPQVVAESVWTPDLVYSSSDETVATVSSRGIITAVGIGSAVITVSDSFGNIRRDCSVTVTAGPEHVHTMHHFDEVAPSCLQDGHKSYYLCTSCGCRFADDAGTQMYTETAEYTIAAAHSNLLYFSQAGYHVQRCKCGAELAETKGTHADTDGDGLCDICHYSLSGSSNGENAKENMNNNGFHGWLIVLVVAAVIGGGIGLYFAIRRYYWGY